MKTLTLSALLLLLVACGAKETTRREGCSYGRNGSWSCEVTTVSTQTQDDGRRLDESSCDQYRTHADNMYRDCRDGFNNAEQQK